MLDFFFTLQIAKAQNIENRRYFIEKNKNVNIADGHCNVTGESIFR